MIQTIIVFVKAHYAICGTFVAAYLLNVLAGHKSQIDSWCNQHPKMASLMKAIRGILPFDPWLIIQAIYLLLTKKLPTKLLTILTTVEATTEATIATTTSTTEEKSVEKEPKSPEPPAAA